MAASVAEHRNHRGKKCSAETAEESKQAEYFSPAGADTPNNLFTPPKLEFIKDYESAKP